MAVKTSKGSNSRNGLYASENVNAKHFGKRVTYPVDGQIYAQPLFVPRLTLNGRTRNVVFVATEHDSVYAFDADARQAVKPLWHTSFLECHADSVGGRALHGLGA